MPAKPCSSWFQGGSQFVPCTRLRRSIEANGSCGLDPNGHWPLGDGSFNRARNHYRGRLRLLREALDQVFGYCRPLLRRDRQIHILHHMDDHTSALRACIPTPSRLTAMRGDHHNCPEMLLLVGNCAYVADLGSSAVIGCEGGDRQSGSYFRKFQLQRSFRTTLQNVSQKQTYTCMARVSVRKCGSGSASGLMVRRPR